LKPRTKATLLALLLLLGVCYRLFAAYPIKLGRFAPASSALQAMHIMNGERPIFYSGQAWMGPAGAYLLAGLFKLFGASTLTLGVFSWLMSVLFLLGTVLLAYRLFGIDNALVVAGLFLVPIDWVMYLAGQPRAHYTTIFALVPVIFLVALALLRRHRDGRPLPLTAFLLGLLCGFAFWTNMAVGPAIGVSMLLLLAHLRRSFFTRVLPAWGAGWVLGFSPVIWYNLTHQAILVDQVNARNTRQLGRILLAFVTNAWPKFWGIDLKAAGSPLLRGLFVLLLVWITLLYVWALVQGWRKWRRGEDVLGYELVFGYFFFHLAITSVSSYGRRFTEGTPLSYIVTLFTVAFSIPALVLQSGLSRRAKALALLPFGLFIGNNLAANAGYPAKFLATVREQGFSRVTRYPNAGNPFLNFGRERRLEAGYLGTFVGADSAKNENFPLNLECFGSVTFSDPSSERYVESALAVDAAQRIFWVNADPNQLRLLGATSRSTRVQAWEVHDDFRKELREVTAVRGRLTAASHNQLPARFVTDGNYDTSWEVGPEVGEAFLDFAFERPERLRELVLFPADAQRNPTSVTLEVSDDGASWRRAYHADAAEPIFWSVWHPFMKKVKPRMELLLPEGTAARFCRLRFNPSGKKAGLAIREILFLGDGPVIDPEAWARDVDDVVRAVREQGKGATVVGDHWFVDYFRREGFATDYISNASINNCGQLSPNLAAPVALDFSRPQIMIVPRAFRERVEGLLRGRGVPFSATAFRYHVVCRTEPAKVDPPLFWNGLELNDLVPRVGKRVAYPSLPLRESAPGATATSLRFGEEFEVTGIATAFDPPSRQLNFAFEVLPLRETRRDWWLFLHVRDAQGKIIAQGDFRMEQMGLPTSRWLPGHRVVLQRAVTPPPGLAGKVSVVVGVHDPRWRKRLRLPGDQTEAVVWQGEI
jgi:hypothetical protein